MRNDWGYEVVEAKRTPEYRGLKYALIILVGFLIFCVVRGCDQKPVYASEVTYTNEQIADAIYRAENSVKYPYGIKSIDTKGNKEYARKICLNTIRNNRKRFAKQSQYKDFISFLGSRYCPTTIKSEYSLNKNWVANVNFYLQKGRS
jgi:hypothetical protein